MRAFAIVLLSLGVIGGYGSARHYDKNPLGEG